MNDESSIEVSVSGFSLKMSGSKAVAQTVQYAADAIGIIGEPLGMIKDSLHSYRIYRQDAVKITMQRAKQIKSENGVEVHPVSQKYLVNWLEGASSEDPHGDNILELWAQLLADAGADFDPTLLALNNILRSIGNNEAIALKNMIRTDNMMGTHYNGGTYSPRFDLEDRCYKINLAIAQAANKVILEFATAAVRSGNTDFRTVDLTRCARIISRTMNGVCGSITVSRINSGGRAIHDPSKYLILEHNGALRSSQICFESDLCRVNLKFFTPTAIGLKLIEKINAKRLKKPRVNPTNHTTHSLILERTPKQFKDVVARVLADER